ncbi:TPA: glutamine synthetase type III, partial [Candidatus Sumerlaeota bacterium]|nr:glutamine synthetase type III [Candidatus Sumerlaeota bacterium]
NIISGKKRSGKNATTMEVGVTALPHLPKDATDRNRTSPFAFTGNKFEFRAVGSAQSIAPANMALNTIVAQSLNEIATRLEKDIKAGKDFNASVQALLQDLFTEHKAIIFNGNGYSEEWQKEAEKRGLPNLTNSVDALEKFTDSKIVKVFEKVGVFNAREVEARREILLENYTTTVSIEALLAVDMGRTIILPAAIKYQTELALSLNAVKAALGEKADVTAQKELLDTVTRLVTDLKKNLSALDAARSEIEATDSSALNKAKLYRDKVLPLMKAARKAADELETIVDDEIWPLPKYREMLFIY